MLVVLVVLLLLALHVRFLVLGRLLGGRRPVVAALGAIAWRRRRRRLRHRPERLVGLFRALRGSLLRRLALQLRLVDGRERLGLVAGIAARRVGGVGPGIGLGHSWLVMSGRLRSLGVLAKLALGEGEEQCAGEMHGRSSGAAAGRSSQEAANVRVARQRTSESAVGGLKRMAPARGRAGAGWPRR